MGLLKNLNIGNGGLLNAAKKTVEAVGGAVKGVVGGAVGGVTENLTGLGKFVKDAGNAGASILDSKGGAAFGAQAATIFGGQGAPAPVSSNDVGSAARGMAKGGGGGDGLTAPLSDTMKYLAIYKVNMETGLYLLDDAGEKQLSYITVGVYTGGVGLVVWGLYKIFGKKRKPRSKR